MSGECVGGKRPWLLGRDLCSGACISLDTSLQEPPLNLWKTRSVRYSCSTPVDGYQSEGASTTLGAKISPASDAREELIEVPEPVTIGICSRQSSQGVNVAEEAIPEVQSDANTPLQNEDQKAPDQQPIAEGQPIDRSSLLSETIGSGVDDNKMESIPRNNFSPAQPYVTNFGQIIPQENVVGKVMTEVEVPSHLCPTKAEESPAISSVCLSLKTEPRSNETDTLEPSNVPDARVLSNVSTDGAVIQSSEDAPPVNSASSLALEKKIQNPDGQKANFVLPAAEVVHETGKSHVLERRDIRRPCSDGNRAPAIGGSGSAVAVSIVASFLRPSAVTASPPTSPSKKRPKSDPRSPPTTPVSLAHLVSGVPTSVERTEIRGGRGHRRISPDSVIASNRALAGVRASPGISKSLASTSPGSRSPAEGSRFLNQEWPLRVKKRRRILSFPKRSEPPGTRVLYWVREYFRARDNLPLSVAMWLSTQLQIPLQAVTFVDPGIGKAAPLMRSSGTRERSGERESHPDRETWEEISFRMAAEASAMCEMEQALRELNIPLVALACEDSDIPEVLARWCSSDRGTDVPGSRSSSTKMASPPTKVIGGGVHIAITDECYHPRQLLLAEKVGQALPGVALYTVDSSSCSPINTFHGGRAATATATATKLATKAEFREAQERALGVVCMELVHRPRLPLDARLQAQVLDGGGDNRAILPAAMAALRAEDLGRKYMEVDWGVLRRLSASRFPSFSKSFPAQNSLRRQPPAMQNLVSVMGGGERVAEETLRQTLASTTLLAQMESEISKTGEAGGLAGVEANVGIEDGKRADLCEAERSVLNDELGGAGLGGALLHLLRMGSISPLRVVQALMQSARDFEPGRGDGIPRWSKAWMRLLDTVMDREYALYRSYFEYQRQRRERAGKFIAREVCWHGADWQRLIQPCVVEELSRSPRYADQVPHSPEDIRKAGLTSPSSVQDEVFSTIQARLTRGGRIHPSLVAYWARSIVRMVLIPSQAIALVVALAEELCLGAGVAGDLIPSILAYALNAVEEIPSQWPPSSPTSATSATVPSFNQNSIVKFAWLAASPITFEEHVRTVLGGAEALAEFTKPAHLPFAP